jgi:spore coat protein CotH
MPPARLSSPRPRRAPAVPRAAALLALCAGAACAAEPGDAAPGHDDRDDKAEEAAKAEFFSTKNFYFVRIDGWDPAKMSPQALGEDTQVFEAEVSIARADPDSPDGCPDEEVRDGDVLHRTVDFSIRTSGNMTKGTPKSSYKIEFTRDEEEFLGMKELNLKSMWNDVSQMREAIAWRMFQKAALPSSRHSYAKFCINDRYYGLYSIIEGVDKPFIKERFGKNDEGNLYKANWFMVGSNDVDLGPATLAHRERNGDDSGRQYFRERDLGDRTYELETNEDDDDPAELQTYDDLATFIRVTNGVTIPGGAEKFNTDEYRAAVEAIFDVESFLRWAALNNLMGSWDNYYGTPANYYLYNSGKKKAEDEFMADPYFHWLPWDYDNSFGIDFFNVAWQTGDIVDWQRNTVGRHPGGEQSDLPLIRHLLRNDAFLAYYLDAMEWSLDELFNERALLDLIGGDDSGGFLDRARQGAMAEGNFGEPSHTGRQFTNDQVERHGFRHEELQNGSQHIFGVLHFARMRNDSAREQLARWRAGDADPARGAFPRGASGGEFPPEPTPIPAP